MFFLTSFFSLPKLTCDGSGGNVAYFTVENSSTLEKAALVDVLACGMGQYGALGNGSYSQAQSALVKVKNVSGNVMCKVPLLLAVEPEL